MFIKNENHLLNFIRYSPVVIIVIVAILINIFIFVQNEQNLQRDLEIYKKNYIESNKNLVKFQVEKVYDDIVTEREAYEQKLALSLKNRVIEATSIIENLHKKYSHLDEKELLQLIKESLRAIRFNEGRGYFYISKPNGRIILHPTNENLENTNSGSFYKNIVSHFKSNDHYLGYINVNKPNIKDEKFEKLSYMQIYKPLNIIIGTGEYKDDFTKYIKEHILVEHIQNERYGKNGYVFVFDYKGNQLMHIKKDYIGKNRIDLVNNDGFMITKEIIKQAKNQAGFISYVGSVMPQTGEPAFKTSYIKGLDDWEWAIGSGFYNYDLIKYLDSKREKLRQSNNESLKKTLFISFVLSILLITLAFYVSIMLKKSFNNYHKKIQRQIDEMRKKDMVLYQQSKMASMGEMLGNIAHQWRQPLSTVSTLASGTKVKKEVNILQDEELIKNMDLIVDTTRHLSQTIDDFREFFNPRKVKKNIDTITFHNKATQLISSRLAAKNIELISDIDSASFIAYENELLQSILNILNNAIDALDKNDIEHKTLEFNIKHEDECKMPNCSSQDCKQHDLACIIISIQDNAGGIDKKHINKIFDAYFTTKHQSQGTGIGLYMTYEIITKHLNGFISVQNKNVKYKNQEFVGANFIIYLPINN